MRNRRGGRDWAKSLRPLQGNEWNAMAYGPGKQKYFSHSPASLPSPQVHEPWESEWGVNCNFLPTVVCLASSMTTVSNHSKNWRIYRIPESTQLSKLPVYSFLPCSNLCVWCSFTLNRLNLLGCTYQKAALFPAHSYPLGCCFSIPHSIFIESYSDPLPCQVIHSRVPLHSLSTLLQPRNTEVGAQPWERGR